MKGLDDIVRENQADKLQVMRDQMKDVRRNVAWKKKIAAKRPPPPPVEINRWDMGKSVVLERELRVVSPIFLELFRNSVYCTLLF